LIKYSCYILLLMLVISGCSTIPNISESDLKGQDNLILNSGFELGQYNPDNLPLGWFTVANNENIVWDDQIHLTGEKSIKVRGNTESTEIISESFPINPSNIYYLHCNVKALRSVSSVISLAFVVFNNNGRKVDEYSETFYLQDSWTKMSFRTGFLSSKARYARVIVILPDEKGSDFWIDDVECFVAHTFKK